MFRARASSKLLVTLLGGILLLSALPAITSINPVVATQSSGCTAPVGSVCFQLILSPAFGLKGNSPVTFTLTGDCTFTPSSIPGDGLPHGVNATSGCGLTVNAPDLSPEVVEFDPSLSTTYGFTVCSSDPCSPVHALFFDDVVVTYSYSLIADNAPCTLGNLNCNPNTPTLHYSSLGVSHSTTTFGAYLTDVGSVSTVTDPLYNASQASCPNFSNSAPCNYRWYTADSRYTIQRTTSSMEPEYYYQTVGTFSASPINLPLTLTPNIIQWNPGARIAVQGSSGGALSQVCLINAKYKTTVDSCQGFIDYGTSPTFGANSGGGPERWALAGTSTNGLTGYYYLQYLVSVVVNPWYAGTVTPSSIYVTPGNSVLLSESGCTIGTLDCTFQSWYVTGIGTLTGSTVSVTVNKPMTVLAQFKVTRDASCLIGSGCTFVQLNWVGLNWNGGQSICLPGTLFHRPHYFFWGNCPSTQGLWPWHVYLFPPNCSEGLVCLQITGGASFDRGTLFYGNLTTYSADYGVTSLGGAIRYFDISFVGFPKSDWSTTMVKICIGQSGAGLGSEIYYWTPSGWVEATTTYTAAGIPCATIPLSDLKGTNIAITPGTEVTTSSASETSTSTVLVPVTSTATTTYLVPITTTTVESSGTATVIVGAQSSVTQRSTNIITTSTTTTSTNTQRTTVVQNQVSTTTQLATSLSTVVSTTPLISTSITTAVSVVISTVTSTSGGAITSIATGVNGWLLGGLVVSLLLLLALLALLMRNRRKQQQA